MIESAYTNGETDKENKQTEENEVIEVDGVNKKNKIVAESLLSPPKKKLKQDAISFPKLSKKEAVKETEKTAKILKEPAKPCEVKEAVLPFPKVSKEEFIRLTEKDVSKTIDVENEDHANTKTPIANEKSPTSKENNVKTPKSTDKKTPSLTKEERQKAKESKEQEKQARLKELEEKRKKKEEEKLLKQAEKEKREHERKEKERLKEEEKKRKEKEKEEERKKREEEKKRKDEEKRIKDEQREAERLKREAERLKREAEKEKREAERKQKEEVKRQEEEKKKMEDEAVQKKKEKAAQQFKSFFRKSTNISKAPEVESFKRFIPFQVKPNMILAPVCRRKDFHKEKLDKSIGELNPDVSLYLEELAVRIANNQNIIYITRRKLRREFEEQKRLESKNKYEKPIETGSSPTDVVIIGDDNNDDAEDEKSFTETNLYKAKFLKFSENTRPAYYGTWSKKSKFINGRKPFGVDNDVFNYEIDSDEEWIDEPGEDCSDNGGDDDDDDEDKEETEEDRDGFFVPHGYLSDDEGVKASDDEEEDDDGEEGKEPVTSKQSDGREDEKLKAKACSYEIEIKKHIKPKKPVCIGITYITKPEDLNPILKGYQKIELHKPIVQEEDEDMDTDSPNKSIKSPQTVPEEAIPFLLKLLHGSTTGIKKMWKTFQTFWISYIKENDLELRTTISRTQFVKTVNEVASRCQNDKRENRYVVNIDILSKYDMKDLMLGGGLPLLKSQAEKLEKKENSIVVTNALVETDTNEIVTPKKCAVTPMQVDT
ncbi:chromatin assembly factor 1 subunit A-B-like isoform X2 [Hydractinia symbiolongicarpus]|nr:chromatin assembly factor 1 subunit A-B-like isoform X2 [Hydractinia symbiolongicarpus]